MKELQLPLQEQSEKTRKVNQHLTFLCVWLFFFFFSPKMQLKTCGICPNLQQTEAVSQARGPQQRGRAFSPCPVGCGIAGGGPHTPPSRPRPGGLAPKERTLPTLYLSGCL